VSWIQKIRSPLFYLLITWVSLILLGANLAIDIFAIPINFRLDAHSPQAASLYAMTLFSAFFRVETYFLNSLIISHVMAPKSSPINRWDMVRYLVVGFFLVYLVYQRQYILPEFIQNVNSGDTSSLHASLVRLEKMKVCVLLVSAIFSHRCYRRYTSLRAGNT